MTYNPMTGTAPFDFSATHWLVRKKPVEVEAIRFNGGNGQQIIDWITSSRDLKEGEVADTVSFVNSGRRKRLAIFTLEGRMEATTGDWIIKGVKGEFYPCKPDIFEQTYEVVRELDSH